MSYIDLHCDTLLGAVERHADTFTDLQDTSVNLNRLYDLGVKAQFMAMFLPDAEYIKNFPDAFPEDDDKLIKKMLAILNKTVQANPDKCALVTDYDTLCAANSEGKTGLFLTIEDGRSVHGKLDKIKKYYDKGVRLISLTWNYENCFGFPNSFEADTMTRGLKPFGKQAVEYMNDLGMIIDVSHLSDGGFWDVAKLSQKPFVASHSNARSMSAHPRNLDDDQIKALAKAGGVMGLNFCPPFLGHILACTDSRVSDMVRHIMYIYNLGGEDILALGTDFDGIGGNLEIAVPGQMDLLWNALKQAGLTEQQIEKMQWQNALRVIKETL